jgi:hypothetical protein
MVFSEFHRKKNLITNGSEGSEVQKRQQQTSKNLIKLLLSNFGSRNKAAYSEF